jgi:hypothetical protein
MVHRERIEAAWRMEEPDRVPIELQLHPSVREDPRAEKLVHLVEEHADNFAGAPSAQWGFLGLPTEYEEEVIEERPGRYTRMRRTHRTPVGEFSALTYHPESNPDPNDYHWEKRYIAELEDFRRIAEAPREICSWEKDAYVERVQEIGGSGLPICALMHPLGNLVRSSQMEEVYSWFRSEPRLVHRYLERANRQVAGTVTAMQEVLGEGIDFISWAHEMLVPPWMGHDLFDEFVFPYDREVYRAIHAGGGRFRAHCHGNPMGFLEKFAQMGVDSIEPLEHPPAGNCILREAKRRVGDRMLLSGNVLSQRFPWAGAEEVWEEVREAIRDGAPGGGFTLRTSGGNGETGPKNKTEEQQARVIRNCEVYIETALECGEYPIRL